MKIQFPLTVEHVLGQVSPVFAEQSFPEPRVFDVGRHVDSVLQQPPVGLVKGNLLIWFEE